MPKVLPVLLTTVPPGRIVAWALEPLRVAWPLPCRSGNRAELAMPVLAAACSTRAAAARRSRFSAFAVVSSGGSSEAPKPFHHSVVLGQTGALAMSGVWGAVKPWDTSPGFRAWGGAVVQPAMARARTANDDERISEFMDSL